MNSVKWNKYRRMYNAHSYVYTYYDKTRSKCEWKNSIGISKRSCILAARKLLKRIEFSFQSHATTKIVFDIPSGIVTKRNSINQCVYLDLLLRLLLYYHSLFRRRIIKLVIFFVYRSFGNSLIYRVECVYLFRARNKNYFCYRVVSFSNPFSLLTPSDTTKGEKKVDMKKRRTHTYIDYE